MCVAPVLDMEEVADVEHYKQREAYELVEGKWMPQPAPRFYSAENYKLLHQKDKLVRESGGI